MDAIKNKHIYNQRKNIIFLLATIVLLLFDSCARKRDLIHADVEQYMQLKGIVGCTIVLPEKFELKYKEKECIVSQKEIEDGIEDELESYNELIELLDKTIVDEGDFVKISYKSYCEGKLIHESESELLKVGAGFFNKDLEEKLVGAKKGEKFTVFLKIPKEAKNKEITGREEKIEIIVNHIYFMQGEQLTDEFVKKNYNLQNVEEFYIYIENRIKNEKQAQEQLHMRSSLMEQAISECDIELNDEIVLNYAVDLYNEYKKMADSYGGSMDEFVSDFFDDTTDDFYERCYEQAEKEVKEMLFVGSIAHRMDFEVKDEEIGFFLKESNSDGIKEEQFSAEKYQNLYEKTITYLKSISEVVNNDM